MYIEADIMNLEKAREILGIKKTPSEKEVKIKFKALAKKWHPDMNNSEEAHKMMQGINKAYELVMKLEFDILDPWKDYSNWWWKQFGNDPLWGNPSAEGYSGKSKKYPGIRKSNHAIESREKDSKIDITKEFLDKRNTFAVVGVSKNPKKYGNKVYKELKFAGYTVYPINPNVDYIEGDKCYPSLNELPRKPDVLNIVVPPEITEKILKESVELGIKKVWLQPGSESEKIIEYCKEHNISVLHNMCIMIERKKDNISGKV